MNGPVGLHSVWSRYFLVVTNHRRSVMLSKIQSLSAVIVMSLAILGMSGQESSADSLTLSFKFGTNKGHVLHRHPHHRYHPRPPVRRYYCSPRHAVNKARHYTGIRHARVTHMSRSRVSVRGYRYGRKLQVTFANRRGCPVISTRRV